MGRPNRRNTTASQKKDPQNAGNALVTPLVFRLSMGGSDCLPSDDPSARLLAYTIKMFREPCSSVDKYYSADCLGTCLDLPEQKAGEGKV
uniref:SFRICE_021008 n=1 Tax=Spodoptera frugiperda TaxID=7108 RepID=A0A2H1WD02_SPOFR